MQKAIWREISSFKEAGDVEFCSQAERAVVGSSDFALAELRLSFGLENCFRDFDLQVSRLTSYIYSCCMETVAFTSVVAERAQGFNWKNLTGLLNFLLCKMYATLLMELCSDKPAVN